MFRTCLAVALSLFVQPSVADEPAPAAWPHEYANVWIVDYNDAITGGIFFGSNIQDAWKEINDLIAKMHNKPTAIVTPEYLMYRRGVKALLSPADFAAKIEELPEFDASIDTTKPWVNLIQPKGRLEANCMAISIVEGKLGGCGDVFQDGLSDAEMACHENQSYVRCHLECVNKLRETKMKFKKGACKRS